MKNSVFTGTGVALVTPFDERDRVDYESLRSLLQHVQTGGVDYLVIMGTTSEAPTLTADEKHQIQQFVVEHNDSNLPIVLGMGGNNTAELQSRLKQSSMEGIDAILSVAPYYNRPTQAGLLEHFRAVADTSKLPVILYNVPARTSSNLSHETTLQLAEHQNIVGIKEASCDMNQCARIGAGKPDDFLLIAGDDMHTLPIMSLGGEGVISVIANALPGAFSDLVRAQLDGDGKKASSSFLRLAEMTELIFKEGNPAGIKGLLSEMNLCSTHVRLPLVRPTEALMQRISEAYEKIGQ